MKYSLTYHDKVEADIEDAYQWYEGKQEGLGERFFTELAVCCAQVKEHPEYYSKIGKSLRKVLLDRFPYIVTFEIIGSTIFVYAVFHTSRNPKEIAKRMK